MTPAIPPLIRVSPGGFPTWLPSMFVKELRQGLRAKGFVGAFMAFQVLMVILMLAAQLLAPDNPDPRARASIIAAVNSAFWTLLTLMLLLVMPLRAMAGLKSEIETRTFEMLVLTRLTAWRIVIGKWASLMAQASLVTIAMLPYGVLRYFGGAVDLVHDAQRCLILLGCCGVLTAAALWASGAARAAGLLVVILILVAQAGGNFTRMIATGALPPSFFPNIPTVPAISSAVLILLFCLVGAVRRIAPPAENYSPLSRILGVLALVPVPLAAVFGASHDAQGMLLAFSLAYIALVCAMELSSQQFPMAVHCRQFMRRGPLGRLFALFLLPGWQTAFLYTTLMALLVIFCVVGSVVFNPDQRIEMIWKVVLAYAGLVFPAVISSLFPGRRQPFIVYFGILIIMSLLAGLSVGLVSTSPKYAFAHKAAILPVTGFWMGLGRSDGDIYVLQGLLIAATLFAAFARSLAYRNRVLDFGRRFAAERVVVHETHETH